MDLEPGGVERGLRRDQPEPGLVRGQGGEFGSLAEVHRVGRRDAVVVTVQQHGITTLSANTHPLGDRAFAGASRVQHGERYAAAVQLGREVCAAMEGAWCSPGQRYQQTCVHASIAPYVGGDRLTTP